MDSHLDVSLGGDEMLYPEELRIIAARTGAHSAIQRITGGLKVLEGKRRGGSPPKLIVAIPRLMLARHADDVDSRLPSSLRLHDQEKSISSVVEFLAETMGIEIYESPPRPLSGLARIAKESKAWVLDVDVDYMREMQRECYTQIRGTEPGVLQSQSNVVRFIRDSKPETIMLSEARVSAIRNRRSNFSKLVTSLAAIGYEIEEDGVFDGDTEVLRDIALCKEFYRRVSRKLMVRHMPDMMRGDLREFEEQERKAARSFFRSKGWAI